MSRRKLFLSRAYCTRKTPDRREGRSGRRKRWRRRSRIKRGGQEERAWREAWGASHTVAWDSRIIPWQTINYWHYVLECLLAPATNHRSADLWPRSVRSYPSDTYALSHARVHARRRSGTTHCPFSAHLSAPPSPPLLSCPSRASSKITINHGLLIMHSRSPGWRNVNETPDQM